MNRIQKSIIATWVVFAAIAYLLAKGWWISGILLPLILTLVRRPHIDDWKKTREFLALKKGRSVAFMVFSLAPMVWFVFRVVTMPELQSIDWVIFWLLYIPLGVSAVFYERWLYLGIDRLPTARFESRFQ